MRKFATILFFSLILISCGEKKKISADDIIKLNIEARGGYDKVRSFRSVIYEGTIVMGGKAAFTKIWYDHLRGVRFETIYNGNKGYTIITPETGWIYNPDGKGPQKMTDKDLQDAAFQMDIQGMFVDYKEKGYTVTYEGKDTALGKSCDKIRLKRPGKGDGVFLFDDDHLLRKTIMYRLATDGSFQPDFSYYFDYRNDANGYLLSYKRSSGKGRETIFNKATTNTNIPDSLFKPGMDD